MPAFAFVYGIFTLSSIGLPLTNGFVGEFLIMFGGFKFSAWVGVVAVTGVILGAVYMLSLYRRVVFGRLNEDKNADLQDLDIKEKSVFAVLILLVFVIGVYPQPILDKTALAVSTHIKYVKEFKVPQSNAFERNMVSPGE